MHSRFVIIVLLLIAARGLTGQTPPPAPLAGNPLLSYILPDVATPGIPVVVEFVAQNAAAVGNLGAVGINPPGVRVTTGLSGIIPGPIVVSDKGRVLDAMIFVPSNVQPNKYQLDLDVNGPSFNPQDFFVSGIQNVGTLNSGGVIGGTFGNRSLRGAMIVDALTLKAGNTFTIDVGNKDNNAPGSSTGYYPASIYSIGPIVIETGATLSVNAIGKDGGPGGGGGGGRGCDNQDSKTVGGNGFTGGGGGGANFNGKQYANNGLGTGPSGFGKNNTPHGEGGAGGGGGCATNGGGGGTGYPFGSGGKVWCSGGAPDGGVGGGSAGTDGNGGGGGAHATNGANGDAPNGGHAYGLPEVVPFCGGSGGSAGNPRAIIGAACGGEGGGGGGAILLYSRSSITIDGSIFANGNGGTGGDPVTFGQTGGGGGGGGGAIILQANGGVNISSTAQLHALGGNGGGGASGGSNGGGGGDGRVRVDNITSQINPSILPATNYSGVTMDTMSSTKNTMITVKGSVYNRLTTTQVRIYVQRADASYQQNGNVNYYTPVYSIFRYQIPIQLDTTGGNTLFCITAVRIDDSTNTLSNAGANIVRFVPPICPTSSADIIDFGVLYKCNGNAFATIIDSILWHGSKDTLKCRLALGKNTIFKIPSTLAGYDSLFQPINFSPTGAGEYEDTLIITDVNSPSCGIKRVLLHGILQYDIGANPASITFAAVRLSGAQILSVTYTNHVNAKARVVGMHFTPSDPRLTINQPTQFPDTIPALGNLPARVQFATSQIKDTAAYNGNLVLVVEDSAGHCQDSVLVPITAHISVPYISSNRTKLDFGTVSSCRDSIMSVTLRNTGNAVLHIDSVRLGKNADSMQFILLTPSGRDSLSINGSVTYRVQFHAKPPDGAKQDSLVVFSDNATGVYKILLTGIRVSAGLAAVDSVTFGSVNIGATRSDSIFVRDTGSAPLCIRAVAIDSPFTITANRAFPAILQRGDTLRIIVTFAPGLKDTSQFRGTLKLFSDCPCSDTTLITISGRGANGVPSYTTLAFGTQSSCARRVDSVPIWNAGNTPIIVDSVPKIVGTDAALFTIIPPRIVNDTLAPGDTIYVHVRYDGTGGTDGAKSAALKMYTTFFNRQDSSLIPVSASRVTRKAATSSPVAFATVQGGSQQVKIVPIINTGTAPIIITGVTTVPAAQFTATAAIPKILNVGDTLPVTVTFRPSVSDTDSTRLITAMLIATTSDTCGNDSVNAQLTGRGFTTRPLPIHLCFAAAQTGSIGSIVQIPIQIDTVVPITGAMSATITILFDPQVLRILSAKSVCGTTQVNADPTTGKAILILQNCTGTLQPGVLATLQCEVLIGSRSIGQLSIDTVAYTAPAVLSLRCAQNMKFTATPVCAGAFGSTSGSNALMQSRPNPITAASSEAVIEYETVADARVTLRMWDLYGREIAHLIDADVTHGRYVVTFDTRGLPNGTYCYTVDAGIYHGAGRMLIMR